MNARPRALVVGVFLAAALSPPPVRPAIVIAPAAAARLRAAGLDPSAPDFEARVQARFAALRSAMQRRPAATPVANPQPDGLAHSEFLVTLPRRVGPPASSRVSTAGGLAPAAASLDFIAMYSARSGRAVDVLMLPGRYILAFRSRGAALDAQTVDGTLSVPQCGVNDGVSVTLSPAVTPASPDGPGAALGASLAAFVHGPVDRQTYYATVADEPATPGPAIGRRQQPAQLRFHALTHDYSDAVMAHTVMATGAPSMHAFRATVGELPPFLETNDLALAPQNVAFGQAATERFNTGATELRGVDRFGIGVGFGATWGGTAQVAYVRSITDTGESGSIDNADRGAVVVQQPRAGNLETAVAWHIAPGASLRYYVDWWLTGIVGTRALTTLPAAGPCDS